MPAFTEVAKPTLHLFYAPSISPEVLQQVEYGIEEEGIPCVVQEKSGLKALDLAWEAAQTSRLSVGLGLDQENLVLHFSKLPQETPLFQILARSPEWQLRALGANGARLVKKMPLKEL